MELSFTNQLVLITGASRGIGAAAAQLFARSGATVVVHYNRNSHAADAVVASLPGSNHSVVQADMGKPEEIRNMVNRVLTRYGRIHILVNNAGIYEEHDMAAMQEQDFLAYWDETIRVNLTGPAYLGFLVAREMIARAILLLAAEGNQYMTGCILDMNGASYLRT